MENFIIQFKTPLILVFLCCVSVFIFVMSDLWAGVRKSKKNGKVSVSYGFRRTVEKTSKYYNYIIAFVFVDVIQIALLHSLNTSNGYSFWIAPFAVIVGTIFIGFIEIKSIFEKEDKKERKRIEESAVLMAKIAELLTSKESREKIKDIINKEENNNKN